MNGQRCDTNTTVPALCNAGTLPLKPKQPIAAVKIRHAYSWKGAQADRLPLHALFPSHLIPTRIPPLHRVRMLQPFVGPCNRVRIHSLMWTVVAVTRQEKQA